MRKGFWNKPSMTSVGQAQSRNRLGGELNSSRPSHEAANEAGPAGRGGEEGLMEAAEVKQVARDGLCRDCKGHGKCGSMAETLCREFQLECAEIEREDKAMEGVSDA